MNPFLKRIFPHKNRENHSTTDLFCKKFPSNQNAALIFEEGWISKLPSDLENLATGKANLFEDPRMAWALSCLDVKDKHVLELGPLEGAHSYMLQKKGARVIAIEANSFSFLKCLVVKEIYGLNNVHFLLGDAMEFLRQKNTSYDAIIAHGILYHLQNPMELIELCSKKTKQLTLWTHYFEHQAIAKLSDRNLFNEKGTSVSHKGFTHTLHKKEYGSALELDKFCGGLTSYVNWIEKKDLLEGLSYFGWNEIEVAFDDPSHPNGPSLALVAKKST